jgi:hypothetical protein
MLRLNIGCGLTKLPDFINIDSDPSVEPDLVLDITKGLPYQDNSVEKIYFSHTIEHIVEKYHEIILEEFWRVLTVGGMLFISYPEFVTVAQNYIDNVHGNRDYWKATIYGRQLNGADFHVSLMDTRYLTILLTQIGFSPIHSKPEPNQSFNTILKCFKGEKQITYEDVLKQEVFGNDSERNSS